MRLLLFFDSIRFFGAMLVVLKVMMKESLIFFALLFVIIVGFLQAFIGMDNADSNADVSMSITHLGQNSQCLGYCVHPSSNGECNHAISRLLRL